jgi:RNA polymerase sigma-70 factor (ECF subfamily)
MMPERPLDSVIVADCHREFKTMLERYAWAIVRDWSLASDAVQNGFVALTRFGGDVAPESRKSWLFKVVHREAVRIREIENRHQQAGFSQGFVNEEQAGYELNPLANMAKAEEMERLRRRIESLPYEQRLVLAMRIFEDKTFSEIAERLQIPLGTALSRMRLALERLRSDETKDNYGK